jgi:hypothetical protein
MKVYKVLDPTTGEYIDTFTAEECQSKIVDIAYEIFVSYTHGNPYSIAEVDEETGAETWFNSQGETIMSLDEIKSRLLSKMQNLAPQTLPVTRLGE